MTAPEYVYVASSWRNDSVLGSNNDGRAWGIVTNAAMDKIWIVDANHDDDDDDNVQVFDNDLSGNATSNVMLISYRSAFTDPHYNPLPRHIMVSGNRHGRAGYDPQLPGGAQLAAAFGGSIPPILWDGTGDSGQVVVNESVPVLGLGLALGAPVETAKPQLAKLDGPADHLHTAVTLPAAMEAAAK